MSDEELTEEMKARLAKVGVSVEDYLDLKARVARSKFVLETIEPNLLTPEQVRDLQKREPETMVVDIPRQERYGFRYAARLDRVCNFDGRTSSQA